MVFFWRSLAILGAKPRSLRTMSGICRVEVSVVCWVDAEGIYVPLSVEMCVVWVAKVLGLGVSGLRSGFRVAGRGA